MLLYPTETIYALGVNALLEAEIAELFRLKGRAEGKSVSWLVRDMADVERWGVVIELAVKIAEQFLPGPLTLVVPARDGVPHWLTASDGTLSFRISSDPMAQQLIADFMAEHNAPLTCTSANVSGQATLSTPAEIFNQFGERASMIERVIDDGPRAGAASTVVKIAGNEMTILRQGTISEAVLREVL